MAEFYTYQYYDPIKREPFYIGKGKGLRAYNLKQRCIHFKNRVAFIKANGAEPEVSFICKNVDEEFAFFCEEEAINLYGRRDLGKGPLLNYTDGGDGPRGVRHSAETRAKMSKSKQGIQSWNKGIPMSEESKAKMILSKTLNRKPLTDVQRKNISEATKLAWSKRSRGE